MTDEKNSGTNLPAQIDIYGGRPGMEYEFLFITKGGGSANKTFLYPQTLSLIHIWDIRTGGSRRCLPPRC